MEYNGTLTFDTQLANGTKCNRYTVWEATVLIAMMPYPTQTKLGSQSGRFKHAEVFRRRGTPFPHCPRQYVQLLPHGYHRHQLRHHRCEQRKTGIRFTYTDMRNKDIVPQTHMSRDIFNLRANTSAGKVDLDFSVNYTREDVKNRPALGDSKSNIGKT